MRETRAKIAVVLEKLPGGPVGGSEAVGVWAAEALKASFDVTIITSDSGLSLSELNDVFGTSLQSPVRSESSPPECLPWCATRRDCGS